MIGRLQGERGVVNRQVGDHARWPAENSIERENRPPRRKAENGRGDPERRLEQAERGTAPPAPLVEIAEQDGRHARQSQEYVEQRSGLIQSRQTKQPEMNRDDAELPFTEIQ